MTYQGKNKEVGKKNKIMEKYEEFNGDALNI